jgi:hypothetical protein
MFGVQYKMPLLHFGHTSSLLFSFVRGNSILQLLHRSLNRLPRFWFSPISHLPVGQSLIFAHQLFYPTTTWTVPALVGAVMQVKRELVTVQAEAPHLFGKYVDQKGVYFG